MLETRSPPRVPRALHPPRDPSKSTGGSGFQISQWTPPALPLGCLGVADMRNRAPSWEPVYPTCTETDEIRLIDTAGEEYGRCHLHCRWARLYRLRFSDFWRCAGILGISSFTWPPLEAPGECCCRPPRVFFARKRRAAPGSRPTAIREWPQLSRFPLEKRNRVLALCECDPCPSSCRHERKQFVSGSLTRRSQNCPLALPRRMHCGRPKRKVPRSLGPIGWPMEFARSACSAIQ